jgi:hypothetical protein
VAPRGDIALENLQAWWLPERAGSSASEAEWEIDDLIEAARGSAVSTSSRLA